MKSIERIKDIADKECECSPLQSTGEDPSVCLPCAADAIENEIVTYIDEVCEKLFNEET